MATRRQNKQNSRLVGFSLLGTRTRTRSHLLQNKLDFAIPNFCFGFNVVDSMEQVCFKEVGGVVDLKEAPASGRYDKQIAVRERTEQTMGLR